MTGRTQGLTHAVFGAISNGDCGGLFARVPVGSCEVRSVKRQPSSVTWTSMEFVQLFAFEQVATDDRRAPSTKAPGSWTAGRRSLFLSSNIQSGTCWFLVTGSTRQTRFTQLAHGAVRFPGPPIDDRYPVGTNARAWTSRRVFRPIPARRKFTSRKNPGGFLSMPRLNDPFG